MSRMPERSRRRTASTRRSLIASLSTSRGPSACPSLLPPPQSRPGRRSSGPCSTSQAPAQAGSKGSGAAVRCSAICGGQRPGHLRGIGRDAAGRVRPCHSPRHRVAGAPSCAYRREGEARSDVVSRLIALVLLVIAARAAGFVVTRVHSSQTRGSWSERGSLSPPSPACSPSLLRRSAGCGAAVMLGSAPLRDHPDIASVGVSRDRSVGDERGAGARGLLVGRTSR